MQRHRFYAPSLQITGQINGSQILLNPILLNPILLNEDEGHHLTRVLRLGTGATVYAFDGVGNEYECRVAQADKRAVTLDIQNQLTDAVDSPLQLTLAQALVKGDKFDLIVQKATELGVTRIVPLITENSDIRKAEERAEQKLARWRRIALESVKQCGRRTLVEITDPQGFADFCGNDQSETRWMFAERDGNELSSAPPSVSSLSVMVGPEGGWSNTEFELAHARQFTRLQLGRRILRTETAAIVAVTLAQARYGDWR